MKTSCALEDINALESQSGMQHTENNMGVLSGCTCLGGLLSSWKTGLGEQVIAQGQTMKQTRLKLQETNIVAGLPQ